MSKKSVGFSEDEPLVGEANKYYSSYYGDSDEDEEGNASTEAFDKFKSDSERDRYEFQAAERLSQRLLSIPDDDEDQQDQVLRESLHLIALNQEEREEQRRKSMRVERHARGRFWGMVLLCLLVLFLIFAVFIIGAKVVGPPRQPIGPYQLVERQEGPEFFDFYSFYEGRDSAGSNGYNMYISEDNARQLGLVNVTYEKDELDIYAAEEKRQSEISSYSSSSSSSSSKGTSNTLRPYKYLPKVNSSSSNSSSSKTKMELEGMELHAKKEPFIYMGSAPTEAGPRDSIRLEGKRRFNRGLFIIDVRHMPAGCGVWPAFWLTDEANWPVNGEIDIVEGVNYQSQAKTALHSTKTCIMDDIPAGVMTGAWDTATGIPDKDTGIPDMTMRYAQNCFVYDPHQWLNQGCVAVDTHNGTLGMPLNKKGGGVFALEWDPVNRHMKTWVFTPHKNVPDNMRDAIRTANLPEKERIMPDPDLWPLPYGYFAIGEGTNCPSNHFKNMRLVFNMAFCGSVAGNRFQLDCPAKAKQFDTCNAYIKSQPDELKEAYWKIRGVFVYERSWERAWLK